MLALYRIYQLLVMLPLMAAVTIVAAVITARDLLKAAFHHPLEIVAQKTVNGKNVVCSFSLPVVPLTIDGAFAVMPRTSKIPRPGRIILTIHPANVAFVVDGEIFQSPACNVV